MMNYLEKMIIFGFGRRAFVKYGATVMTLISTFGLDEHTQNYMLQLVRVNTMLMFLTLFFL